MHVNSHAAEEFLPQLKPPLVIILRSPKHGTRRILCGCSIVYCFSIFPGERSVVLFMTLRIWRLSKVSFLNLAAGLQLITRYVLESILSVRPGKVNMQQSSGTSPKGGPARDTDHDAIERKFLTKGRQRPSRDDRMLKGVGNIIRNISVEFSEAQEEACEAVTIKNYEFIASYSWKDIDHPTIYVPGLSRLITGKRNSS